MSTSLNRPNIGRTDLPDSLNNLVRQFKIDPQQILNRAPRLSDTQRAQMLKTDVRKLSSIELSPGEPSVGDSYLSIGHSNWVSGFPNPKPGEKFSLAYFNIAGVPNLSMMPSIICSFAPINMDKEHIVEFNIEIEGLNDPGAKFQTWINNGSLVKSQVTITESQTHVAFVGVPKEGTQNAMITAGLLQNNKVGELSAWFLHSVKITTSN